MKPPRLTRLDFVFGRDPIYFVTTCVEKRRDLLANAKAHDRFKAFAEAGPEHGAWMGKYVLMPDHLHFFVGLDDEQLSLSQFVKSLKGTLSSHFRASDTHPPYWQKVFFDHLLRSSESYSEKWNYVQENPVRAGLVKNAKDWPYAGEIFDLEFVREFY